MQVKLPFSRMALSSAAASAYAGNMNCVVTAGPTYEALDAVRRLTNLSTGRLGTELANYLSDQGHAVRLLLGEQATFRGVRSVAQVDWFSTTADLQSKLEALSGEPVGAVFHAAAVSDFSFGQVWQRTGSGGLTQVEAAKISTQLPGLLVELTPTPKIIASLERWFPEAIRVGWKYEVDGNRAEALGQAQAQLTRYRLTASVANGPAYGPGYGLLLAGATPLHLADRPALFAALARIAKDRPATDPA